MQVNKLTKDKYVFILSILSLFALILDFGYPVDYWSHLITDIFYSLYGFIIFINLINSAPIQDLFRKRFKIQGIYFVFLLSILQMIVAIMNTGNFYFFGNKGLNFLTAALVFLLTMFDLSWRIYALKKQTLHPALVFVLSFFVLICLGTLMLMLPKATYHGIDFVDALFTSTSAVCVTGLVVLDTGKDFTRIGQFAILLLIQFGALGMLSFTSLFGMLFRGFGSYENRLNLKNLINADSLESTFKTLIQIIVFVVTIEILGTILIYYCLDEPFETFGEKLFFAVFHSISAFSNAGFSTLTNSLGESQFQYDYNFHLVIAMLIVLGGIGYGVVINLYEYIKKSLRNRLYPIFHLSLRQNEKFRAFISLNTKIVLVTTIGLILIGSLLFYFLEYNHTLAHHSSWGKFVTALFGSITTRTAGFNTVDTGSLTLSTLMIVLLLMWIGASPGSTGGGIKTTTFAIASLNIVQQAFGFKNIRVGWKRIEQGALQRSTSIISLSLIMIGLSIFLLVTFDGELGVMPLAFECISAYSTVGLSMGITADLSTSSKLVIIFTMFVGRVGFLTLITGIVRQVYKHKYSPMEYPEEKIFIN